MQTLVIIQSHDQLLELQDNPTTPQLDIENLKTEIRVAVLDYLTKHIVTRDMMDICKAYITGDDISFFQNHLYNYNKFKLIFKK